MLTCPTNKSAIDSRGLENLESPNSTGGDFMARESMLTIKSIVADDTLASLTGQSKGALLSYTELTKSMHQYIRTKGLKLKACPNCKEQIPGFATFCDKCGKDTAATTVAR